MRQNLLIIFSLALAVSSPAQFALATTNAPVQQHALTGRQAQNIADIASIEAYSKQLDAYTRRNARRGRLFGDTASPTDGNAPPRWQEFKTKSALERAEVYSAATLWSKPTGAPVVAAFSLSSPSGDWAQYVNYYYRTDGTLAKIHAELRTFMGDLIVIRDRFYDPQGRQLSEKTRYLDLNTRKPKKVEEGGFMDIPFELYAKTSQLPFYPLIHGPR
jgi:hypothetical protein